MCVCVCARSFDEARGKHTVRYAEDGVIEHLDLSVEKWRFSSMAAPPLSAAAMPPNLTQPPLSAGASALAPSSGRPPTATATAAAYVAAQPLGAGCQLPHAGLPTAMATATFPPTATSAPLATAAAWPPAYARSTVAAATGAVLQPSGGAPPRPPTTVGARPPPPRVPRAPLAGAELLGRPTASWKGLVGAMGIPRPAVGPPPGVGRPLGMPHTVATPAELSAMAAVAEQMDVESASPQSAPQSTLQLHQAAAHPGPVLAQAPSTNAEPMDDARRSELRKALLGSSAPG